MIVLPLLAKYSSPPGAGLAGRFDQSPRACDYRPGPPPVPGLYGDFPATARHFP
jgi:hypothetical protein